MERKIVVINEEKCTGCGLCARACHEGAIKMIEGKAHLISESYCDGLGDCLPHCLSDAITIETKNVASYDHEAFFKNMEERIMPEGELINWPIQLKLAPVRSPLYNNGHLLIAASCTAFSYKNFYKDFMHKRALLIGCFKLDNYDYTRKLKDIFENNNIKSITIVRMDVPCCGGLVKMVEDAAKMIKYQIHMSIRTISTKGELVDARAK